MEAPPSTTNTRPSPCSSSALRTRGLFSKHFTVATWPLKRNLPPKSLQQSTPSNCVMPPRSGGSERLLWPQYSTAPTLPLPT